MLRHLSYRSILLVGGAVTSSGLIHAGEIDDAKAFLASRPEIKHLLARGVTPLGPGLYQVNLGLPGLGVFLVKQRGWNAVLLGKDTTRFRLTGLVPENVLGRPQVKVAFAVVATADGSLNPAVLPPSELRAALVSVPECPTRTGVNLFALLTPGDAGALGQLKKAGLLPGDVLLAGTVTRALTDQVLKDNGTAPPDAPAVPDLSMALTASAAGFTPAPFNQIRSPRLTFGNLALGITRTGPAFSLTGEQKNSTLLVDGRTYTIPSTRFTFSPDPAGGYAVAVEGRTFTRIDNAFGIKGVTVNSLGVKGTVTSAAPDPTRKSVKGFGLDLISNVSMGGRSFDGSFSANVDKGKLSDLSLNLAGDLDLGFTGLPNARDFVFKGFGVGVNPTSGVGYVYGSLAWQNLTGDAAAVMVAPGKPALFLHVRNLDLGQLLKSSKLGSLPKLDALVVLGAAKQAGTVEGFPDPVKAMISEAAGALPRNIQLANGLTLLTHMDAASLGADKLGITGNLVLGGAFDVTVPSASFYASLSKIPDIKGLPAGFGIDSPEFLFNLGMKDRVPVLEVGVGLNLMVPLNGDPRAPLLFRGQVLAATTGNFSFTGSMETDWKGPLGLKDVTIKAPVAVTVGVGADASVDFGFQGGTRIGNLEYNPMAFCVNIQAAAPVPVPKKLALNLKGSEFGVMTEVTLVHSLIKSAIEGPLKNGIPDAEARRALAQIGAGSDRILTIANGLPLPLLSFKNVEVYLATPGITCQLPAMNGMGAKLKGTAFFMNRELGNLDSYITLKDGFKLYADIKPFNFYDLVTLNQATLDVLVPMPGSPAFSVANPGHFYLKGDASVLLFKGKLQVALDKNQASFEIDTRLADLGNARFWARTIGTDLMHANDFQVGLRASGDAEKQLLKKLGQALKTTAAARRKATQAAQAANAEALKKTQAEFDALDRTVGRDFRAAEAKVAAAERDFRAAQKHLDDKEKECKKILGPLGGLCDFVKVAKEAVKTADRARQASINVLEGIRRGSGYANLIAKQAAIGTIKAEAAAFQGVMQGWGVLDRSVEKLAQGLADNVISLDKLALDGSVRKASGSLEVTAKVGASPIHEKYTVNLMDTKAVLDVVKLAEKVADEVEKQAKIAGSAVQKAFKA